MCLATLKKEIQSNSVTRKAQNFLHIQAQNENKLKISKYQRMNKDDRRFNISLASPKSTHYVSVNIKAQHFFFPKKAQNEHKMTTKFSNIEEKTEGGKLDISLTQTAQNDRKYAQNENIFR